MVVAIEIVAATTSDSTPPALCAYIVPWTQKRGPTLTRARSYLPERPKCIQQPWVTVATAAIAVTVVTASATAVAAGAMDAMAIVVRRVIATAPVPVTTAAHTAAAFSSAAVTAMGAAIVMVASIQVLLPTTLPLPSLEIVSLGDVRQP